MSVKTMFDRVAQTLEQQLPTGVHGVYVLEAPETVPTYGASGQVFPYLIIGLSPGSPIDDKPVSGLIGGEAVETWFTITTVTAAPLTTLELTEQVATILTDLEHGDGTTIRPDTIYNRATTQLTDSTVRPHRYYTVTRWGTTTTMKGKIL